VNGFDAEHPHGCAAEILLVGPSPDFGMETSECLEAVRCDALGCDAADVVINAEGCLSGDRESKLGVLQSELDNISHDLSLLENPVLWCGAL
jgi:hypothetical protein